MLELLQTDMVNLEALPCGFCRVLADERLTILKANTAFYKLYGYTQGEAEELGFTSINFITYPVDWPRAKKALQVAVSCEQKADFTLQTKSIHRSGAVLEILVFYRVDLVDSSCLNCILVDQTAYMEKMRCLEASDEERRTLLKHTGRFVFWFYPEIRTAIHSQDAAKELGMPLRLEGLPESIADVALAPDSRQDFLNFYGEMLAGKSGGTAILHFKNGKGDFDWYSCAFSRVYGREGRPAHMVVSFENASIQREKEIAFEKWKQYNQTQLKTAVLHYECNLTTNRVEQIQGAAAVQIPQEACGTYDETIRFVEEHFIFPEDRKKHRVYFSRKALLASYESGKRELQLECRRTDENSVPYWSLATIQMLMDPYTNQVKASVFIKNIDKAKRRELELRERSQRDALTGVLNRGAVVEQTDALLRKSLPGDRHALIMADIDHFKRLNDSMGHQFGDRVLEQVASTLKNSMRSGDLIGRLGGDEFVLLLRDMPNNEVVARKAENFCRQLALSSGKGSPTSGSFGIAVYPDDGLTFQELYQKADIALYEAKRLGRSRFAFYHP